MVTAGLQQKGGRSANQKMKVNVRKLLREIIVMGSGVRKRGQKGPASRRALAAKAVAPKKT